MRRILFLIAAAALLAACNTGKGRGPKSLVVYYSQSGATGQVARLIQEKTGADIAAIVPESPYDGDYRATIERCRQEREEGLVPAVLPLEKNVDGYDTLYIGFPVWFGTYALPVSGFLKGLNAEGKVVIPFCTFGSGGLETATADLKKALPGAIFLDGYGVRNARIAKASEELDSFLVGIGAKEGKLAQLPAFSEAVPVSGEDVDLFEEACGGYQMPLGTPVSVARREIGEGMEYRFSVESKGFDGKASKSTIYVVRGREGKAEFTRVVR